MTAISDSQVKDLLLVIRNRSDPRYIECQLSALYQLERLSEGGNADARMALLRLRQDPDLPPQLQEFMRKR